MHSDRRGIVLTVLGLAAYVTGLQKAVLTPVLEAFADLPTSAELAVIVVIGVAGVAAWVVRTRRRDAALALAARAVDERFGSADRPGS